MNRFNSLMYMQHFNAQNSKRRKEKKMQFTTIWKLHNTAKHFEKLTSES